LSTIHRAKGLEADRVWFYEPGLCPSHAGDPQELNLLYVALTRAKKSLFFVDDTVRRRASVANWVRAVADGHSRHDLTDRSLTEEVLT
jgi:superfamily I DNA/RNA helicase